MLLLLSVVDAFFQALLTRSAERKQGIYVNLYAMYAISQDSEVRVPQISDAIKGVFETMLSLEGMGMSVKLIMIVASPLA